MEFPNNPTRRELRRQQDISSVIRGIADSATGDIEPDFVPEDAPISGMQDVLLERFEWPREAWDE